MKRAVGWRRFCAAGALALLCGCTAPDPERQLFDRVAAELDSGGSYYTIQNPVYLKQALKELRKNAEKQLWDLPVPKEKKERFQLILSSAELLFHTAGLTGIEGVGKSSRRMGDKWFKNTAFLALPANPDGVLWQFLSSENTLYLHELENLPKNTTLAGAIKISPQALAQKIQQLYPESKALLPLPLRKDLDGIWRFALILKPDWNPNTGDGVHIMAALPDPQKKLFNQLAGILQFLPGAKVDRKNNRIALPPLRRISQNGCGLHENGTLFLFSSPKDEELFRNPAEKLKDHADFRRAAAVLRQPGVGVFYADSTKSLNRVQAGLHLECGFDEGSSIGVIERKADGIKWVSCAPCDWNVAALQVLLVPAAMLLEPMLLAPEPKADQEEPDLSVPNISADEDEDIPPFDTVKCENNLKTLYNALKCYRKDHNHFPEKAGIAGLRELLNQKYITENQLFCPAMDGYSPALHAKYTDTIYLYFGTPEAQDAPLLMERPCNHGRCDLRVILANGNVRSFVLEKTFSVRKAVSFLHTKYHYEEKEFMRLMELAAEFDKILEL